MNNLQPFDYVLALGIVGSVASIIPDINEGLRFLILLATFAGILVKTWEQVKKSDHFMKDLCAIWKWLRGR